MFSPSALTSESDSFNRKQNSLDSPSKEIMKDNCRPSGSPNMFSPPALTFVSDSFSSNPESPASSTKEVIQENSLDVDFASKAFVNNLLERGMKEERFRIDRKKLEDMLQTQQSSNSTVEKAEPFFQRVMLETSTQISWPSKLKIGSKSKKDPHVKIVGKPDAVLMAKEQILEILDTKKNRVTLKMDVSHSDHSYIIGKGGFKIQQVMEETGCHIHFPDSNRNNPAEKSNQVSIAGDAIGVELARTKIRDLLPLVFMFELPNGETINPREECSPAIQHIQQTYSFNVAFRNIGHAGFGITLLEVRGCQRLLPRLRQGLSLLMEYLTGSKTIPMTGFMKTEIAAQHHRFVMGSCGVNSQMIMNKTGATIIFPDSCPSLLGVDCLQSGSAIGGTNVLRSKSTVIIQGSFDSVCLAWQELLKCLPLVLMFDLRERQELDPVLVNNFMETFNISIMVRPKIKENTKSVLVRGAEKDSKILFEVRKEILGLEENYAELPKSSNFKLARAHSFDGLPQLQNATEQVKNPAQNLSTVESLSMLSTIIQQNPRIVGLLNDLSTALPSAGGQETKQQHALPNPTYRDGMTNFLQHTEVNGYATKRDIQSWINRATSSVLPARSHTENRISKLDGDSGVFIHPHRRFIKNFQESRSDISQPEYSSSSTSSNDSPDYKSTFFKKMAHGKEPLDTDIHKVLADYGNKNISANKAMKQPVEDFPRTRPLRSGYGFSKSTPNFAAPDKRFSQNSGSAPEFLKENCTGASSKTRSTVSVENGASSLERGPSFCQSNFWETIQQQPAINYSSVKRVDQLLLILGLEKYNDVFLNHEVDLSTFVTLTEIELQELGISYGARRKILAAVTAVRDQVIGERFPKTFHAAPGAERRMFFPRYSAASVPEEE